MLYKKKKSDIVSMFNNIAPHYDFLNHLLSFNIDKKWRRELVKQIPKYEHERILDIATGTGDVAFEIFKNIDTEEIVGIDISKKMLEVAKSKLNKYCVNDKVKFLEADSIAIPFDSNYFDIATISFGIRNFEDVNVALQEIRRVLKKNGMLIILEFSKPQNKILKTPYQIYSKRIMPTIGKLFSGNYKAYKYLNRSSVRFPAGEEFGAILYANSYKNIKYIPLMTGIATIYICVNSK